MPNIHKRKDGYYYVRIPIGKDEDGKHRYDIIFDKKKTVLEEKLKDYEKNKGINGERLDKTPFTLSEWTYRHLFNSVHSNVSASTFNGYMSLYETHIKDSDIGNMKIKDIKPMDLQNFLNNLKSKGKHTEGEQLATSSVRKLKFLLSNTFKSAMINNVVAHNPMDYIKLPKNTKKEKTRTALTVKEQAAYIKACDSERYGFLYILALFTGMRMGELIGLKRECIDLKRKIITIAETIKYTTVYDSEGNSHNEHVKKAPKSEKGKREIPIPKSLLIKFKELQLQSAGYYVFSTSNGTPLNQGNINRGHTAICERAGINHIPFHSLRHTYATRLLEAGENFKTLQDLLGHADIGTTMNIYAHVLEKTKKNTADKLDKLFSKMV